MSDRDNCDHRGLKWITRVSIVRADVGNIQFQCGDCLSKVWVSEVYLANIHFDETVEIIGEAHETNTLVRSKDADE